MNEDQLPNEAIPDSSTVPIFWKPQDDTELVAEIFETLLASVKIVYLVTAKQEFHTIRQERIVVVLHHNTLKDLFIRGPSERFQNKHYWDNVFLLSPTEPKHGATVGEVMECIRYACLVRSDATNLYG